MCPLSSQKCNRDNGERTGRRVKLLSVGSKGFLCLYSCSETEPEYVVLTGSGIRQWVSTSEVLPGSFSGIGYCQKCLCFSVPWYFRDLRVLLKVIFLFGLRNVCNKLKFIWCFDTISFVAPLPYLYPWSSYLLDLYFDV